MIHFTSDTHWHHARIAEFRGYADADEMNAAMIEGWNTGIHVDDIVYHLGDVSFAGLTKTMDVFEQLNGHVYIVPGNHDKVKVISALRTKSGPVYVLPPLHKLRLPLEGKEGLQRIILCHFPIQSWEGAHDGYWHLHGHSHGFLPPLGRRADVGVDAQLSFNYRPVPLAYVREVMALRSFEQVDQHKERSNG